MQKKFFFLVIQFLIQYGQYNFINSEPLIGEQINSVVENEFLSVVCIMRMNPARSLESNLICTGTLVTTRDVVTSEQCFILIGNRGFGINFGSHNISAGTVYFPLWWLSYDHWAVEVGAPLRNRINDIGMIRINLRRFEDLPSIPLAPFVNVTGLLETVTCGKNMQGRVPPIKQTVPLFELTNQECESRATFVRGSPISVPDHCICTLSYPYAILNFGDIGGPLIVGDSLFGINVGSSPTVDDEFHPDKANIHIRIESYKNFIRTIVTLL